MIQKISFQNYKAFERGEIKIKPITILLGANSVGKSSIINLLLMLQQTANSTNYKSALRLHGENVSMGECENIFRNKNTENNIIISFEFKDSNLKDLLSKQLLDDLINILFQPISFLSHFYDEILKNNSGDINLKRFLNRRMEISNKVYDSKKTFLDLYSTIEAINTKLNDDKSDIVKYYLKSNEIALSNKKLIEALYEFLTKLREVIKENVFNLSFELQFVKSNKKEDVLKIREMSLIYKDLSVVTVDFTLNKNNSSYGDINIVSDFINEQDLFDNKIKKEFLSLINFDSTIFSWPPSINRNRDLFFGNFNDQKLSLTTYIISIIINRAVSFVRSQFTRELINHVSPLRAHPKRYYFLDKSNINTVLDTLDGNSLTEVLKENDTVRNLVNDWLGRFGLKVDVSTLQDVIHKLKIHQNTLDLDITDVGFGISQILPVIVQGFLSFKGSLTMVEQPEIHLHPKMQADLADLFIDVVKSTNNEKKFLLIETHSEYLLRRLRRRIAEGLISSDDIAIYFVSPPKNVDASSEILEKEVAVNGSFEWPEDFYADELKKDTTEFIKHLFLMICYTLSDCVLNNINIAPNPKEILTDLLMVFAQNNNPYKIAIDKKGKIIDIYSRTDNPAILYWLQIMSDFPKSWECINVENFDSVKTQEESFLLLCSQTTDKMLIVYSHNEWIKKYYNSNKDILYNGVQLKVLDREEAIRHLMPTEKVVNIINDSIVAMNGSNINNAKILKK